MYCIYTVEPLNNGHTKSESFVLCREVVFIHVAIAIQSSLNQYTKRKVLFKFGRLEKLYVEMISKKTYSNCEIYMHTLLM